MPEYAKLLPETRIWLAQACLSYFSTARAIVYYVIMYLKFGLSTGILQYIHINVISLRSIDTFSFKIHSELSFQICSMAYVNTFFDVIMKHAMLKFFHVKQKSARNTTNGNVKGNWHEKLPNNFIFFFRPNGCWPFKASLLTMSYFRVMRNFGLGSGKL